MTNAPHIKYLAYRADIDGLRAIAVLLVLGYHLFPEFVAGGFIGVDIFFVISGYLITGIILNGFSNNTFSFGVFFARRIKRIYPALLLVLVCCYIVGWLVLMPLEYKELNKHILGAVGFVANFTLWQDSGYFDAFPELKPLLHLWSLGIEEQFYLLWPLGLWGLWKCRLRPMALCISLMAGSFFLNIIFITKLPTAVFYFPFSRFWELLLGSSLTIYAWNRPVAWSVRYPNTCSWLGVLLLLVATTRLDKYSIFPGWNAVLPALGAFLLIASKNSWLNSRLISHKVFVWIGLISYPLYLWHWPIISFFNFKIGNLAYNLDAAGVVALSFLLSWITYKFVEIPVRRNKNSKAMVVGLLLLSLSIGAISFITYIKNGVPSRMLSKIQAMPKEIQDMLIPGFGGYIAANWREHTCFLQQGENSGSYKPECSDLGKDQIVFLWGDSHAAALYPGLKSLQNRLNFGIAQYTVSACPPVLNWDGGINKLCRGINNYIFNRIKEMRPDIVILQAAWYWPEYDGRDVTSTIEQLKNLGIKKIVILGSVPNWKVKVPENIVSFYKAFGRVPPIYTNFGLADLQRSYDADQFLESEARRLGVSFVSIKKTLCDDHGCMLSTGNSIGNVTSLDHGHLSEAGSEYVMQSLAKKIFEDEKL